ncbi:helix-turn-helix domain-containing protein [Lactobacillus corticis]|uniref:AraC family transcriptional regulator n=1 Tax=Lactobacillus corticis TaxID=2201249 RepID=A0A916QII1_9LACO|nr:helix-turn-helix transcriptional regulator [Lactobacillus corticis]GFZ27624.1 AraC family transcriptional regulator [Lactobacillus corticis]
MAAVELTRYLESVLKSNYDDKNELKIPTTINQFDLFTLYLENHNSGIHSYQPDVSAILYLLSGRAEIRSGEQTINLNGGNLVLVTGAFGYEVTSQSDNAVFAKLKFKPGFIFSDYFARFVKPGGKEQQILKQVVDMLGQEQYLFLGGSVLSPSSIDIQAVLNDYLNADLFAQAAIEARLTLALVSAFKAKRFAVPADRNRKFQSSELDHYIDIHYADTKLADAAKYFGFNPNYFSNLVKKETGKSFVDHVDERRMIEARRLLAQPNVSLHDIIGMVGYSSKSFFYKKFNEFYGTTPAAMRRELFRQANINLN